MHCLDSAGIGETVRKSGHIMHSAVIFSPSQNKLHVPGTYLTIKRSLLDMIVAQRAVDLGAVFAVGEVKRLFVEPDGLLSVAIRGSHTGCRARIGIVATGTDIRLPSKLDWSAKKRPSAVALRCYVRSSMALDRVIFSYDKSIVPGYGWIFPMGDYEYNVGCGRRLPHVHKQHVNLNKTFKNFIDAFPLARDLMRRSQWSTRLRGAAIRSNFEGLAPFVNGPLVAVGETIGTTLPFSYEGIGKAMESGQRAAEVISAALDSGDTNQLGQYHQQIESQLKPRYRGYRQAEKWLSRPWLNNFMLNRYKKSKYAKAVLAGIVAEIRDPLEIFSLSGILKTFWK
jgi:flavin-dependent dehydrogenase